MATSEAFASWWVANRRRFAIAVAVTWAVVCSVAIVAGLDRVLRGGFEALAAVVALPFVIAIGLIVLFCLPFLPFVLIAGLLDADIDIPGGHEVVEGTGKHIIAPYFRWIRKQRSPIFWGIPSGIVVALVCLAVVGHVRSAPERAAERKLARTRAVLEKTQGEIADEYERTSRLPPTVALTDPYGHEVLFVVRESSSSSSYTLTSLGPDGVVSSDDVCVDGNFRRRHSVVRWLVRRTLRGAEPDPVSCRSD